MTCKTPTIAAAGNPAQLSLEFECKLAPRTTAQPPCASGEEHPPKAAPAPAVADHVGPAETHAPSAAKAEPFKADSGVIACVAEASAPSEYSVLGAAVPPGRDPALVRDLTKQILGDAESTTILDQILAREIAGGTVLLDYFMDGMSDAFACYTADTARELATKAKPSAHAGSQISPERQLRGRTQIAHLDDMMKHLKIYNLAQASRNASITMFDTRRLNILKAALAALEIDLDD